MSQQASLFDFAPPPTPTDRIFFAIAPDAQAIADIGALAAQLKARNGMRGRPIAEAKLHCTLCNLGDFVGMPDALIARASEAAALVAAGTRPFKVSFNTAQTFITGLRHRPLVLTGEDGVAGVTALYLDLASALLKAGVSRSSRSYTPRVTPPRECL